MKKGDYSRVSVVPVHGAFADASSWRRVIPLLEKKWIRGDGSAVRADAPLGFPIRAPDSGLNGSAFVRA
jgi:hypothetical protein